MPRHYVWRLNEKDQVPQNEALQVIGDELDHLSLLYHLSLLLDVPVPKYLAVEFDEVFNTIQALLTNTDSGSALTGVHLNTKEALDYYRVQIKVEMPSKALYEALMSIDGEMRCGHNIYLEEKGYEPSLYVVKNAIIYTACIEKKRKRK